MTFVEHGQYQRATEKQQGKLGALGTNGVILRLNQKILPKLPHGNDRLSVPVTNIDFMGWGRYLSIAYILDSPVLLEQRRYVTDALDELNGVNA